jgi:hypothetical protein
MPHYAALLVAAKVTAKVHHYTVINLGDLHCLTEIDVRPLPMRSVGAAESCRAGCDN